MLRTLYKEEERFKETYYSRFADTYYVGDAARKDEDGYFWILGRADDAVNVSGHLLSTAEVESAVVSYPKVAECAVIGDPDEDTGQPICAFVTLEGDLEGNDEIEQEIATTSRTGSRRSPARSGSSGSGDLPKTLRQDHAPAAARHRRGPRARRRPPSATPP